MSPLAPPSRPRATAGDVLLLGAMAALPAMSSDIYLPSLPEMAADLDASTTAAQLTMTVTFLGGAVGQFLIGPLSDRFGRRRPALIGIAGHVVTSLLAAVAPTIGLLIAVRVLQGIGNAAAVVVAMAVIRDRFVGAEASRLLSRLMLVVGVAPLFAPSIGGFIAVHVGWRGVFVALAVVGVGVGVAVWARLPESLPPERRRSGFPLQGYRVLGRDRQFVAHALLPGLVMVMVIGYVIGSPFVLQDGFGLSTGQFAAMFAVNGLGLVGGAQLNAALVHRRAPEQLLRVTVPLTAVLSLVLVAVAATGWGGFAGFAVALWLVLASVNLSPPNATAIALGRHGEIAGTAAAFIGTLQTLTAGLVTPLVGLLGGDAVAMTGVMAGAALLAVVVVVAGTPVYRRRGPAVDG